MAMLTCNTGCYKLATPARWLAKGIEEDLKMSIQSKLATGIIAVICAAAASMPVQAVDLTATEITSVNGRVEVKKTDDALFKKLHSNLKLAGPLKRLDGGDKVRTYEKSGAEMALKETCVLAVKEQSIFEVPQVLGQAAMQQLTAQQGTILFKVVSGSNFQVQTADVIAGVKGTLFEVDIVDNFVSMIETPALQIGTITPGATNINVYKGEVELTHRETGRKRKLQAGEGLAALSSPLMKLDSIFSEGFTPMRKFNPVALLTQNFGSGVTSLLNIDASLSGLTSLPGLGNFNNSLGSNRLTGMFGGVSDKIQKLVGGFDRGRDYIEGAKELSEAFGPGFRADFSKYRPENRGFMVTDSRYKEVYLGNKSFAACKAGAGSKSAKFEPIDEGVQLTEGNAMFRVCRFKNADTDIEFLASHYVNGKQLVTTVDVIKGELYGRIPGSLEHFRIPANEPQSFVYSTDTGKGSLMRSSAGALEDSLKDYNFSVAAKLAEEKGQHDQQSNQKKKQVGEKILNKVKIKKFW
ncbi:MAG: hypothetical protein CVV41_15885 [Candidatus Riflebacteria bacterium HGW-Riflebacteria-1]|nr:MAG: hypothetical protein CVV41_15885 [Candidatus Riflebacteria bacterium HGW-Riflebacteria-1]